ncbi:MAG: YkgJ family cysteine cluster protein [Pyrobaculum sp.]
MFTCPIGCPSECCKFESLEDMPVVLEEEIPLLKNEAEKIGVELHFQPYGEYNGIKLYKWVIDGWCPFYRGKCTIHEKKPLSCRMYPLVLNLKTGEVYLSEKCLWVKINGPKPLDHFPHEKETVKKLVVKLRHGRVRS